MKNKHWLVGFTYDSYCQGYEEERGILLVRNAPSFEAACNRVRIFSDTSTGKNRYLHPRDFENLTVDLDSLE